MTEPGTELVGPSHLLILIVAIILDAMLGDTVSAENMRWHPRALWRRGALWCDDKLNRATRGARDRRRRGVLVAVVLTATAIATGALLSAAARHLPLVWLIELLAIASLIDMRRPYLRVADGQKSLSAGDMAGCQATLIRWAPRAQTVNDPYQLARLGFEILVGRLAMGGVGPIIGFAMFGLAGAFGYSMVLTLVATIGDRGPDHADFGQGARRLAAWAAWPVQILTSAVLAVAVFPVPGAGFRDALSTWANELRRDPSDSGLWPQAVLAGALGLSLGGPKQYGARTVARHWVGRGRARVLPDDLKRALTIYIWAGVGLTGLVILLWFF